MRTHKAAPGKGPRCKPRAESHRGFLNQNLPKPGWHSVCWAAAACGSAAVTSFPAPQPSVPAARLGLLQHIREGQARRGSCPRRPRGRSALGLCSSLGFIYSGSANSQDESETEERFIKKESVIISKKKKNKHLSVLETARRRLGLDSPGSVGPKHTPPAANQGCCLNPHCTAGSSSWLFVLWICLGHDGGDFIFSLLSLPSLAQSLYS